MIRRAALAFVAASLFASHPLVAAPPGPQWWAGSSSSGTPLPTGSVLWLEADSGVYSDLAGTTPAANGDPVRSWRDQSSNAFLVPASVGGSAWPKFRSSSVNSQPAIDFDSITGTFLELTGQTNVIPTGNEMTMLFVVGPPTAGGSMNNGVVVAQDEGSGDTDKWIVSNGGITASYALHINDASEAGTQNLGMNGTLTVTSSWEVFSWRRKADGTWSSWDGTTLSGTGDLDDSAFATNTGPLTLGKAEGILPLVGQVALVAIFPTAVSDGDMTTLQTYAVDKYTP